MDYTALEWGLAIVFGLPICLTLIALTFTFWFCVTTGIAELIIEKIFTN